MGIIASYNFLDAYTPICNNCGVRLCYDISEQEYLDYKTFWDGWKCEVCEPEYKQISNIYKILKEKEIIK